MRLIQLFRAVSWKHVLGELLLIVVGVLLALAVNNWNTNRQTRHEEVAVLRQLRASLAVDLEDLRSAVEGFHTRERRMELLRDYLQQGRPYADSLDGNFGSVLGFAFTHLNRSPYEVLKAKGLDLISDDSLRLRIIDIYDQTYEEVQGGYEAERNLMFDVVRPYYLHAFRDIHFRESATPLHYERLARDSYFRNLLDYRLASLQANAISPGEAAIGKVVETLTLIDRDVGHLQ